VSSPEEEEEEEEEEFIKPQHKNITLRRLRQ